MQKLTRKLSSKQRLAWGVMSVFSFFPVLFVVSRDYDLREPFVAGVALAVWGLLVFFCGRFIRTSTDENARMIRKRER
jgi:4-amino-4-deoxy-L-arabinose transferase-like glycosyltransferase